VLALKLGEGWIEFNVRLSPRSHRDAIEGLTGDALKVRVSAAPVDNAANDALVRTLARALDHPKSSISIVGGHSSRTKRVRISGLSERALLERLGLGTG